MQPFITAQEAMRRVEYPREERFPLWVPLWRCERVALHEKIGAT